MARGNRYRRGDHGPTANRAVNKQGASERKDPVFKAAQTGTASETGTTGSIVSDADPKLSLIGPYHHRDLRRSRVPGSIRQSLGDDEVGSGFDRRREALRRCLLDPSGNPGSTGQGLDCRAQPFICEE
jgi:hypothetical protein